MDDKLQIFRNELIADICAESVSNHVQKESAFIAYCKDILQNDLNQIPDFGNDDEVYIDQPSTSGRFRSMHIDDGYLELATNTLHLIYCDYDEDEEFPINNEFVRTKVGLMEGFVNNALKGYFSNTEDSDLATQLGRELRKHQSEIVNLNMIIVSTNSLSKRYVENRMTELFEVGSVKYNVNVFILDIEKIYNTKSAGFAKEDIVLDLAEYGLEKGIPFIKVDVESDSYESYLAAVPGKFLSDIYKKYAGSLLDYNVRSYLNARNDVNKGILNTIYNEKDKFFAYNNGITTTADSIETVSGEGRSYITKFTNLQIINGGQTTASLAYASIQKNADLSGIYVQMKLTILKNTEDRDEFFRKISKYSNKQNKVTSADLTSNHQYYVRIANFSKNTWIIRPGTTTQSRWFFERSRGEYEQSQMQMTKSQKEKFKIQNPKQQKFTKGDLAKYINCADEYPFDVCWGNEVNLTRFQTRMEEQWDKDQNVYNERYFQDLIAKAIMYKSIVDIIDDCDWYQENKGYRAEMVAYTFSYFVHLAAKHKMIPDYERVYKRQQIMPEYANDLRNIAKIVFDTFYDPSRSVANVREYAKRDKCWNALCAKSYDMSNGTIDNLISKEEVQARSEAAKRGQKEDNHVNNKIIITRLGISYWQEVLDRNQQLSLLNQHQVELCDTVIRYLAGKYRDLYDSQVKELWAIKTQMDEYIDADMYLSDDDE